VSRDIIVQDIPADARSTLDIADDWRPAALPFDGQRVVDVVTALAPGADFSDPSWGVVDLPGASIEVSVPQGAPLEYFAVHVRGPDKAVADAFITDLLAQLGVRAFDTDAASGIFGS
jgi:hypothetical protein